MVRLLDKELEDIISYIKNSDSYKKCIEIQEKMESNVEIKNLVANVKSLQKQYVKSDFQNEKIKKDLDCLEKKLNHIPIYVEYIHHLNIVNDMIGLVRDSLNEYFYKLFNENN